MTLHKVILYYINLLKIINNFNIFLQTVSYFYITARFLRLPPFRCPLIIVYLAEMLYN